jgi:hypothetical protein
VEGRDPGSAYENTPGFPGAGGEQCSLAGGNREEQCSRVQNGETVPLGIKDRCLATGIYWQLNVAPEYVIPSSSRYDKVCMCHPGYEVCIHVDHTMEVGRGIGDRQTDIRGMKSQVPLAWNPLQG